jgi:hypothetical protein
MIMRCCHAFAIGVLVGLELTHSRVACAQVFLPDRALQAEAFYAWPSPGVGWPAGTVLRRWTEDGRDRLHAVALPSAVVAQAQAGLIRTPSVAPVARYERRAALPGALERQLAGLQLGPLPAVDLPEDTVLTLQADAGSRESLGKGAVTQLSVELVRQGLQLPARYYIITDTVSVRQVSARVASAKLASLKAALHQAMQATPGGYPGLRQDEQGFTLVRRFDRPWQVFYAYSQIEPIAGAAVGSSDVGFDLLPGLEPLPDPTP